MKKLVLFLLTISVVSGCTNSTTTREVIVLPNGNGQASSSSNDKRFVELVREDSERAKRESSNTLIQVGMKMCSDLNDNKGIEAVYREMANVSGENLDSFTYLTTIFVVAVDVYCPQHQNDLRSYNESFGK
jgi:hypothetical protein